MQNHARAKLKQILLGAGGMILVVLVIILQRGIPIPLLYAPLAEPKLAGVTYLAVSCAFFFPPYFMMLGILGLYIPVSKEEETNSREFMASYAEAAKSRKNWVKHLGACTVGIICTFLLWYLNYAVR